MPHYHFVTGRLAEFALRETLQNIAAKAGFEYSVQVLGISVAALMTAEWVSKRIEVPPGTEKVILPGYCRGDLAVVEAAARVPVALGPKEVRQLPEYFGLASGTRPENYGDYDIQILAEINHAPRLDWKEILRLAQQHRQDGAELIDLGCDPGETWSQVGEVVAALRAEGFRLSIDSYNPAEIAPAAEAGAELVLSVNHTNRHAAADWGIEVVAVPDDPRTLGGLETTLEELDHREVPFRIDPILEPIGFGFTESLIRYWQVRQQWPEAEMMMGIGNLTELTDVDSAGVNVLLLGICQELGIRSVLTTEVINWARTSVRECDLARRLVYYAVTERTLPKRLEPLLVMLRDPKLYPMSSEQLQQLAEQIKDPNFRIFAQADEIHVMNSDGYHSGADPFELFEQMQAAATKPISPDHAFYLGFEMAKALTALTLSKNYQQDQALNWGLLTREEVSHEERKQKRRSQGDE